MMIEDVNQALGLDLPRHVETIKAIIYHIIHKVFSFTSEDSDRREKRADELADALRRTLFSKRHLVLVDDVWESSVWDDLRPCIHDRSKIILTTRHLEIANCATSISGPVHLRMLNDDESWKLLEDKKECLVKKVGQHRKRNWRRY
ncbi:putative late blight resistance protein homolog R1B-12 [Solanum tuberosum]|uniref:putative late blight resistance protein homolog R1B-12 n=1 Tax=Solanum tuberosum TaxID=4113 RepID=UPI00073A0BC7|nr:PREDICTED: putative late blight resistance protein homolog R1B-12 [Solanum tuberosum]